MVQRGPLEHHEAGLDVDLLKQRIGDRAVGAAAERREIAVHGVVGGQQRGVLGGDLKLVQVGLIPVAGADLGDCLVMAAVDHVDPHAEAVDRDRALPPGENRRAVELLYAQVGRNHRSWKRREPDQLPSRVEDHRAGLGRNAVRREKLVPRGLCRRMLMDRNDRRQQVRPRDEALAAVGREMVLRLGRARQRVVVGHAELEAQRLDGTRERQLSADGHSLTARERRARQETAAVALRVGLDCAPVRAAL